MSGALGPLDELLARCSFPDPPDTLTCALSGGPDSSALLALAVHGGHVVTAVHVHHGLRPEADDDAEAAERIARRLGAEFRLEHAPLDDGPNLEARARDARRTVLGPDAATGHTADDQAETVLLGLLRGSGAAGLAAMRPGPAHPILALRRADTRAVCDALDLQPAVDASNRDPRFRRNRVRHEILPLLDDVADRDVVPLIARAADLLRDDDDLLDHLATDVDPTDARALAAAPLPIARRAIRMWLTSDGHPPDADAVARVLDVASGRSEACEISGGRRIQRSKQRLSLFAVHD